jgi:hypothetical protein
MYLAIKIPIIESERGWGERIDDYMVCKTMEDAKSFIDEFNSKNTEEKTPDWYMYAENSFIPVTLTESQTKIINKLGKIWWSTIKNM